MTKHPRIIAAIALVTLTSVALTGCLVEKKEPEPPYYRNSDNLRIYKQGDWIRYNVIATTLSGTSAGNAESGTLEIRWGNYSPLTSPDGNNYDVIEKVITVEMSDSGSPVPITTVHYVQQDVRKGINPDVYGTEQLVAMEHPNHDEYYWLNTEGGIISPVNNVPGGQEPVITLKSPLLVGQSYRVEYTLMDDCYEGPPGCLINIGESLTSINVVGDSTQINTNLNNYANPFQVDFNGEVIPAAGINPLPLLFDIFDVCSDLRSTHSGKMYVIPEIGVIQLTNTCTNIGAPGDIIRYDITIDSISSSILSGS